MKKHGKWEVIEKLGEGGQGAVYLVKDTLIGGHTGRSSKANKESNCNTFRFFDGGSAS